MLLAATLALGQLDQEQSMAFLSAQMTMTDERWCHQVLSVTLYPKSPSCLWKWINSPVLQWSNKLGQSLQCCQHRKEKFGLVSSVGSLFSADEFLQEC